MTKQREIGLRQPGIVLGNTGMNDPSRVDIVPMTVSVLHTDSIILGVSVIVVSVIFVSVIVVSVIVVSVIVVVSV